VSYVRVERGYRTNADLKNEIDVVLAKFQEDSQAIDLIAARSLSADLAA
jgi:hypothetical protein